MTVIVLAPHPDDESLGCGGTLAKYHEQKERTVVVVFSGGAFSHPLHKEHIIVKTRKDEALAAHKILGVSESVFFMLDDANLKEDMIEKEIILKLHELIKKEKPKKIFMPSLDDPLPDHRSVAHAMLQVYSQYSLKCGLYTYTIWNPLSIIKRRQPRLVVDITDQQAKKLAAIQEYKSQWVAMFSMVPVTLIKTFLSGMRYGHQWAEVFIQVK